MDPSATCVAIQSTFAVESSETISPSWKMPNELFDGVPHESSLGLRLRISA